MDVKRKLTFGEAISDLRHTQGLNQRELAAKIAKEDGKTISQQYLNDIENGRRGAPSPHIITQMAKALDTDAAFLAYKAGQLPSELRDIVEDRDALREAIDAFRRAANKTSR
jgi:transcriptional regulator with XRE-family HTH domain